MGQAAKFPAHLSIVFTSLPSFPAEWGVLLENASGKGLVATALGEGTGGGRGAELPPV